MKPKPLIALLLTAAVAASSQAVAQGGQGPVTPARDPDLPIVPGWWESTNKVLSPIRKTEIERRCVTAKDIDKFLNGPSNRHYKCAYPTRQVGSGKMFFKGTCRSKDGIEVAVTADGAYRPTSFEMKAKIRLLIISATFSTEAKRLGDTCPIPGSMKVK